MTGDPAGPGGPPVGGHPVPAGPDEAARVALADAVRRLTDVLVAEQVPTDVLVAATRTVAEAGAAMAAAATGPRVRPQPDPANGAQGLFPTSPVIGPANPVAPPVRVWAEDDGIAGEAWFGPPYEGPPGCVHGGVIAMLFDELLGAATVLTGRGAMTGTLTVRYRRPTPLGAPLAVRARCAGGEGRKLRMEGSIVHDGVVTAEARGLFVQVTPKQFVSLAGSAASGSPFGAPDTPPATVGPLGAPDTPPATVGAPPRGVTTERGRSDA